ncbi:MAG: aminotransferase class III-fold pyridoxal phosphate-dependent enzyme [Phycisphaerales bacterium]|nr:aminotransferase class III-fold pyridoxal phosphate-dependent enzyme [Phycisphaerales bacterium]
MTTANPAAQPATLPSTTLGAGLRSSPAVRAAADALLAELARASSSLTQERPPNPGLRASYDALLARASEVRGRALLYPFIGSGLGNGALVELADGSVKWDMVCGIGVNFFGHSDPDLTRAAIEAGLDDVVKHGNLTSNADAYEFSSLLVDLASRHSALRHCYLATSGAMANENALKICFQKHSPASRVIAFRDCFMGRSTTMSQIGDAPDYRQGLPLNTLVDYMPFYDPVEADRQGKAAYIAASVARLEDYIHRYPGQHACFIFELIQGEGGFNIADPAWARALMECCRKHRIAVWDDEIQTFGRTPRMFAFELMGVGDLVDVLTVGKMTQCCATLFSPEYNPKAGLLSGTFTGETVSFRVGTRVLQRLRDGAYYGDSGSNARHHALFRKHAADLIARHPDWFPPVPALGGGGDKLAGGLGGMMRLTAFGGEKARITAACKACLDEGVIVFYCGHGPYHLRLLPPLGVFNDADWPRVFAVLERALAKVK